MSSPDPLNPQVDSPLNVYDFETQDYVVAVQPSLHSPRAGFGCFCYAVVNKETEVVEAESYQLPAALSHALELQRHLNDIRVGRYQAAVSQEIEDQFAKIFGRKH